MATLRQETGATHQFKGTAPTTRADGTPLAAGEISHYERDVTSPLGDTETMDVLLVDGEFNEVVSVDALMAGTYKYAYRTVDTDGRVSADSNTVLLEVLPPLAPPNPPVAIG